MGAESYRETAADRDIFRDQGRCNLVHLEAAEFFWNIYRHQAQITGLSEQAFHDVEVFCLDRGNLRLDLFFSEVHRCVLDLPLNIRDIFPGEDISGLEIFNEKASAGDAPSVLYCRLAHAISP